MHKKHFTEGNTIIKKKLSKPEVEENFFSLMKACLWKT